MKPRDRSIVVMVATALALVLIFVAVELLVPATYAESVVQGGSPETNPELLSCPTPIPTTWRIKGNCGTTPGTHFLGTTDNKALVIKTNNTERMRIDTAGNVGIGAQPNFRLTVNNGIVNFLGTAPLYTPTQADIATFNSGGNARLLAGQSVNDYGHFDWIYNSTPANARLAIYTNGNQPVTLNENGGNVGIGTASPAAKLQVVGNTISTADNTATFYDLAIGPNQSHIHYGTNGDWYIRSASSSGKVILQDTGGNVGIGTTTPSAPLTVHGPDTSINTLAFRVEDSNGNGNLDVYDNGIVQIGALDVSSVLHACYDNVHSNDYTFASCSSAAEYVPTIDGGAGFPETADLVSLAPTVTNPYSDEHSPFVVQKSATACDANLLGFIVNPESGADGPKLNDHYLPLAIYGYFPAKVTMENGAIQRGDPLTSSSKSGYGMKATGACKIIGYALDDANQEGTIQVFANTGETSIAEVASLDARVKDQDAQISALKSQNADLQKQMTALDTRLTALENGASAQPRGKAHLDRVEFPSTTVLLLGGILLLGIVLVKRH